MANSQDESCIADDGIDNPVVSNTEFPQSCELTGQYGKALGLGWQFILNLRQYPVGLVFTQPLQVSGNRSLECDIIAQALFSYQKGK